MPRAPLRTGLAITLNPAPGFLPLVFIVRTAKFPSETKVVFRSSEPQYLAGQTNKKTEQADRKQCPI